MRRKHARTLNAIFSDPIQSGILWRDIETMLEALGAEIYERRGSRVCVSLNGIDAVFHRPHPRKETDKGAVSSMRRFLKEAGVEL
ncbi:MAG: HicA protein [uncultured bacterium]|nr:MAG: HicA protein [uncultured bacterium]OGT69191.1 MAG: hexulose-6-phosphate isomerase [Gammaproteobacteria bacterium RIFCSPLOWO2_02_FULL_38_11]HBG34585.1 hexulose-6-phosphate isomerase [Holosporales bacterium]HLD79859.1 type II toxin-antitoxin system HicA family toxin [Candidatus Nanoarchaeia archaeon]HLE24071.1 type II toxin-antitoxin system HicA family toxin [Thermodesulfobacteriota bacterium]